MSFSFGFEDDDDIEVSNAEMKDAPSSSATPTKQNQNGPQQEPAAEIAQIHKLQDLVFCLLLLLDAS